MTGRGQLVQVATNIILQISLREKETFKIRRQRSQPSPHGNYQQCGHNAWFPSRLP